MRKLLEEAMSNNLELLPNSPDLIPEHITEFLLFALPITEHKHTRAVLLSSYFYDNKSPLSADPEDLVKTIRNLFPITEYDTLSRLSEYRAKLKEFYYFDQIPLLYFNLLSQKQKEPLLLTPQDFKATKLHQALKLSNKARKLILLSSLFKSTQAIVNKISIILQQIDKQANYPTSPIAEQDLWTQSIKTTHLTIQELHKAIYRARNLENNAEHREHISHYINRRYQNFTDHTILMIDSILKRHIDKVSFPNIRLPDLVIMGLADIKDKIKEHFTL
ncbi:29859_t:CDS:2 [Gigaspora margarita]|uniref:29859_t:CDS:1 n=1 Tax=Gigaspora margarita TaxID=4874 RepID=A0ABN7W6M3_GIGMA|nr:29859_t:CDS:2 [Gigaspora margarita]